MNNLKDPFFKVVLAALPLLGSTSVWRQSFEAFSLAFFGFWFVFLIFRNGSKFFPERLLGFLEAATLAVLALLASDFLGIEPFWAVSVFYGLHCIRHSDGKFPRSVLNGTLGFWLLGNFLGFAGEFLGGRWTIPFFTRPAGIFLLIGFVSWLWQNRPVEKARPRRAE